MSYYPGLAQNIFHSMNKIHETKLSLRREQDELRLARGTPTTENDDDDYQNQDLYGDEDDEEEERQLEIKLQKQLRNLKCGKNSGDQAEHGDEEFEQEDETSKRERLHLQDQERKRRKMLSEALEQFSEETKTFRDRQSALMQVKSDAERKWNQIKSVRMKVAALQAVAVSGKTRDSSSSSSVNSSTSDSDDEGMDEAETHHHHHHCLSAGNNNSKAKSKPIIDNSPQAQQERIKVLFKRFSADHELTAKEEFLGESKFHLPPPKVVYNALSESALTANNAYNNISNNNNNSNKPQNSGGNNTDSSASSGSVTSILARQQQEKSQLRLQKMRSNLRSDFRCPTTSGGGNGHQGLEFPPSSSSAQKPNQQDKFQLSHETLGTNSASLNLNNTRNSNNNNCSSANATANHIPHHLQEPPEARRLCSAILDAAFSQKMGGRETLPSLDALLEEQRRMKIHADMFAESTSSVSTTKKTASAVPMLKQHDPTLLTSDPRILALLRKHCSDDM